MKRDKRYLIVVPFPYDLSKPNFQNVYIGDPEKGLLGRGITAVITAFERNANVIAFGGGVMVQGEHESLFEQQALLSNLKNFKEFLPSKEAKIFDFISEHSLINFNKSSDNTEKVAEWLTIHVLEELTNVSSNKIELCIVTDPGHLRPIQLVSKELKNFRDKVNISVVLSDTPYSNEEMAILEGPLYKLIKTQVDLLIEQNKQTAKTLTLT